jgi:hypothetical protein
MGFDGTLKVEDKRLRLSRYLTGILMCYQSEGFELDQITKATKLDLSLLTKLIPREPGSGSLLPVIEVKDCLHDLQLALTPELIESLKPMATSQDFLQEKLLPELSEIVHWLANQQGLLSISIW